MGYWWSPTKGHLALGRHLAAGHGLYLVRRGAGAVARCRGGVEGARAGPAERSLSKRWGPGAAARASVAHTLKAVHRAFPAAPGEPGHSLQAVKYRAAITAS